MPLISVLHYTRPELGIVVPWWSALLLPVATTASVIVHTPRSLKYAVLYVLYENVLALHKAWASLEGMLACKGGFKWPVTNKTGRSKRRGFSLDIDWKALRAGFSVPVKDKAPVICYVMTLAPLVISLADIYPCCWRPKSQEHICRAQALKQERKRDRKFKSQERFASERAARDTSEFLSEEQLIYRRQPPRRLSLETKAKTNA